MLGRANTGQGFPQFLQPFLHSLSVCYLHVPQSANLANLVFLRSYANSVLQALYFCGPFRDLVVQYPDPSSPDVTELPPLPALPPPPPPPLPTSPPQSSARPKSSRKGSISETLGFSSPLSSHSSSNGNSSPGAPSNPPSSALPIPSSPPTLLSALRSLYVHISRNPADKGVVAPRAFIDKLKELNELFRSSMHQDAHEFLNYLLNQIVEEMEEERRRHRDGHMNGNGDAHTEDCTHICCCFLMAGSLMLFLSVSVNSFALVLHGCTVALDRSPAPSEHPRTPALRRRADERDTVSHMRDSVGAGRSLPRPLNRHRAELERHRMSASV
jgi:hypothetical protein